jgi:tetratricopeptide (TPR) repeat protein
MSKAVPVLALLSLCACHLGHDEDSAKLSFEMAEFNYQNGKYDQAKVLYERALEGCPGHPQAKIGFGNACREFGNRLYRQASELAAQERASEANKLLSDANDMHTLAFSAFTAMLDEEPVQARYGLALFHYQRAVSGLNVPLRGSDRLARQRERDLAIGYFQFVVKEVPQAYTAHRYLGLALFAAGRFNEGRVHLKIFHDAQQDLYEQVVRRPAATEDEKKLKDRDLRLVERDIQDIRDVLGEYFIGLQREKDKIELKKERTPEETQELARVTREALELESYLKSFRLVSLGEAELQLRQRCQDFLDAFNRGVVLELLAYIDAPQGEEARVQRMVEERVSRKIQYRKVRYRSIQIDGVNATVSVTADQVTERGTRANLEFPIRFRSSGGQWKAAEVP